MNCDDCGKQKVPDATGDPRCRRCDEAVERMVRGWHEDAIAAGEA